MKDIDSVVLPIVNLIRIRGYKVKKNFIYELLCSHPDFPSLASISDTLTLLDIPHFVYKLEYEDLLKQGNSLLHLNTINGGNFVILDFATNNQIYYYDFNLNKKVTIAKKEFLSKWSKISLEIESNTNYKRNNIFNLDKVKNNIIVVCVLLIVLMYAMLCCLLGFLICLLPLIISIIGVAVTWFINRHELHLEDRFTENICKMGKNIDCNAVLSSKSSMLFGKISLGEIGLSYFLATTLMLFILPIIVDKESYLNSLYIIAICSLPYTLYSLIYQKFVIHKWCPFCLVAISMMWGLFISYNLMLTRAFFVSYKTLLLLCFIYINVFAFVMLVRSIFEERMLNLDIKIKSMRFKRNSQIFEIVYRLQNNYLMNFSVDDICFGNLNSNCVLTTVISESCKHCKSLVELLINIIENKNFNIKWNIRFYCMNYNLDKCTVFKAIIAEYMKDKCRAFYLLKMWCMNEKLNIYNVTIDDAISSNLFEKHFKWIRENRVDFVPSIFINNKKFPSVYNFKDLPLLLSDGDILSVIANY
ncbi:vitamin K epoxide reductase family protein [Parabacteroides sp. ASD2025]|uniref:vitamin K epoxide reductase family protein n=1 Tax=Parabacteroides sp. ASD2025 TaxID=3415987 RepID=UPI003CEE4472